MTDLAQLVKPFPDSMVKTKPGKFAAAYVEHSDVTQRLLEVVGPFGWTLVREVYDDGRLVGVVGRMTVEVDGREVTVEEAGDVEDQGGHKHNGARLKDASSDAIKRCAMRLGLGLHLWAGDHYWLDKTVGRAEEAGAA
jgi:hypothetical protein